MALKFKSSLDDSQFESRLNHMESSVKESSEKMKTAFESVGAIGGAFGAGVLLEGVEALSEHFGRIKDQADAIDLPVEEFQRLSFVFQQSGSDAETFQKGMAHLTESLVKARDATSAEANAMKELGLNLDTTNESDATGALANIADAYVESADKGKAFAAIADLVGSKVAIKMIPALIDGGDELRKMAASADVASEATIALAKKTADSLDAFKTSVMNKAGTTAVEVGKSFAGNFQIGWNDGIRVAGDGFFGKIMAGFSGVASALGVTAAESFSGNGPGTGAVDEDQLKLNEKLIEETKLKKEAIDADRERIADAQEQAQWEDSMLEVLKEQEKKQKELLTIEKERAAWRKELMAKQDELESARAHRENNIQKKAANEEEKMMGDRAERMEKQRKEDLDRARMSVRERHAMDRAAAKEKRFEDRFDKAHPNDRRAIEQARRLEQEAKAKGQKLEAELSNESIEKLKAAIELLVAR